MRPTFHPRLVNGAFEDPALYIPLTFRKQALLFDMGDLGALSPKEILKISHVFVSHTHMDHFVGFDRMLRLLLGRPKILCLYGPQGFLGNVAGKLKAYTWNLVRNYSEALVLNVTEIRPDQRITQILDCRNGFIPSPAQAEINGDLTAYQDPELTVHAAVLDHQIPCLGFSVKERFHVNILKSRLDAMGLPVGPWLSAFKALLFREADATTEIEVPGEPPHAGVRTFELGYLASEIVAITPGQKTAYVADVIFSRRNEEKIIELAEKADHLFIEAAFLEKDRHIAATKFHLTARQAGCIARKAGIKQLTVFHHSPRYLGQAHLLIEEARAAFEGTI
jgi:ribonuclease Z